jgi:hypothetical protein
LESVGVKDVLAKSKGSSNPHSVVKATINALIQIKDPYTVAQQYFDGAWSNLNGRQMSVGYEQYKDESKLKYGLYRFMEWSGLSTF